MALTDAQLLSKVNKKISLVMDSFNEQLQALENKIPESVVIKDEVIKVETLDQLSDIPVELRSSEYIYLVKSDISNDDNPSLYFYKDAEFRPFTSTSSNGGSTGGSENKIQQLNKLGVTASVSNPKHYSIEIPYTRDFTFRSVEVLKLEAGNTNVVISQFSFDNGDASDFFPDNEVVFDGTMKIKDIYAVDNIRDDTWSETGFLTRTPIKRSEYPQITGIRINL